MKIERKVLANAAKTYDMNQSERERVISDAADVLTQTTKFVCFCLASSADLATWRLLLRKQMKNEQWKISLSYLPSPAFFRISFKVSGMKEVIWWVSSWPSANDW